MQQYSITVWKSVLIIFWLMSIITKSLLWFILNVIDNKTHSLYNLFIYLPYYRRKNTIFQLRKNWIIWKLHVHVQIVEAIVRFLAASEWTVPTVASTVLYNQTTDREDVHTQFMTWIRKGSARHIIV